MQVRTAPSTVGWKKGAVNTRWKAEGQPLDMNLVCLLVDGHLVLDGI